MDQAPVIVARTEVGEETELQADVRFEHSRNEFFHTLKTNRRSTMLRKLACIATILIMAAAPVFAVQTPLTTVVLKQNTYAVVAGDLTLTPVAMDATNGNSFYATGREILIVQNTDASAHTFTITSVADQPQGRLDTSLTGYSVAANGFSVIQFKSLNGWIQPGGQTVYMTTRSALLKIAVIQYN